MRINKYLASCGKGSRRKCETLVLEGRVKKNGRPISELSADIGPNDIVTVDGFKVVPPTNHVYIMLNKPKGYICSRSDEKSRKTVFDLINSFCADPRLVSVGRLDYDTEGLLLLTTDGDLTNKLAHPRNEIEKTYVAKVEGEVSEIEIDKLCRGVVIDGVKTKRSKIKLLEFKDNVSRLEIKISEGRNRQIRKMFESITRQVIFLKRMAIGDLRLGGITRGSCRFLRDDEINYLKFI